MADVVDRVVASWRTERPDLDFAPVEVVGRLQRLARLLDREIQSFAGTNGLEQWELDLLFTLRRAGAPYELSAGALAKAALVTSGAITNRIDRLTAKDLVERVADPADRRAVRVRLTAHGLRAADELIAGHVANEARLLQTLSARQHATLATTLRRLLEDLGDEVVDR
jgi:DNA-binding MarR family transcriptional regulator